MGKRDQRVPGWLDDDFARQIEELCSRYEDDWRAERSPRIADYVSRLKAGRQARVVLWLRLVRLDRRLRASRGEVVRLAEYRASYPDEPITLDPSTAEMDRPGDRVGRPSDGGTSTETERPPAAEHLTRAGRPDDPTAELPPPRYAAPDEAGGPPGARCLRMIRPGLELGHFVLLEVLGSGGMGVVFKAHQRPLNRVVALKVIREGALADARDVRLFRAEAEAVAALDHPHIVPILACGEHDGLVYYSMKLIEGRDLNAALADFRDQPRASARLIATVAGAIQHAHERGILHRDLKPSNVLLDTRGEPHVIDFGLAKRVGVDGELSSGGIAVGTPRYMAPEQALGLRDQITTATDIHGLGALFYALLTGRAPYDANSPQDIVHNAAHKDPPRPRSVNSRVDPDLETICLKCLSKLPGDRYASARELADDLFRWLDGRPILARPASLPQRVWKSIRRRPLIAAMAGLLMLVLVSGIAGIVWQWREAVNARDGMRGALEVAQANEDRAQASEDDARRIAYAATLNLAARDWRDAYIAQVRLRLDEARPPQGKSDLRGWEWYYLDHLCRARGPAVAGHTDTATCVAYAPDGRFLASGSWDGTIRLSNPADGRTIRILRASDRVFTIAVHPDGRLASGGSDRAITIWDTATGQPIRRLAGHTGLVDRLAFSRDGRALASSSWDGTVRIWDPDTGTNLHSLDDHREGQTGDVAFSPDGKTLASAGGGEQSLRFWDVATGRRVLTLDDDRKGLISSLAISPDGKLLATGAGDGTIRLIDSTARYTVHTLRDRELPGVAGRMAFSRDGKMLASGHLAGQVSLWDVATGFLVRTIRGHDGTTCDVAMSPDGQHLASAGWDGTVQIWDASRDQEARVFTARARIRDIAFAPDGSYLAACGFDGTAELRSVSDGQPFRTLRGHAGALMAIVISADGRRAATAGEDRTIRIWDIATGKELRSLAGHTAAIYDVAFAPDGKTLVSACDDRTIRIWDTETGHEIRALTGHAAFVRALSFSRDGAMLASGDLSGFVMLWNIADGRRLRVIPALTSAVFSIAISPDGRTLAAGGPDRLIAIRDLSSGEPVRWLRGHGLAINKLTYSSDGRRLFSAGDDRTIRIWDTGSGRELMVLQSHSRPVQALAVSPDGTCLASAGDDSTIRLWETDASLRAVPDLDR